MILFAAAGLALIAGLVSNLRTISSALGLKRYKPPELGGLHVVFQGAFAARCGSTNVAGARAAIYAFPSTNNPYYKDPSCFSVPVLSFTVTNPNDSDMMISGVLIEAEHLATQDITVGMGPMIAGADFMIYECVLNANESRVSAVLRCEDHDYVHLSAGELVAIRVHLRSSSAGLYRVRPICQYIVGRRKGEIAVGDYSDPIYFFDEIPQTY